MRANEDFLCPSRPNDGHTLPVRDGEIKRYLLGVLKEELLVQTPGTVYAPGESFHMLQKGLFSQTHVLESVEYFIMGR